MILTLYDATTFASGMGRERHKPLRLAVNDKDLTLRQLIRRRVLQEVSTYNETRPEVYQGLVQPEESEQVLNGYRLSRAREIDAEAQCRLALNSFERNGFMVLVDDRQVDDLDQKLQVTSGSEVVFLKLVPLVGG